MSRGVGHNILEHDGKSGRSWEPVLCNRLMVVNKHKLDPVWEPAMKCVEDEDYIAPEV